MENEENQKDGNKHEDGSRNNSCFGWWNMPQSMTKCCEGMRMPGDSRSMMAGCMKMCRGFPLIGLLFGITFLLLGYYLEAEALRLLWMIFAGFVVLMATFGMILMGSMKKFCC